jgi:hypothetical protein
MEPCFDSFWENCLRAPDVINQSSELQASRQLLYFQPIKQVQAERAYRNLQARQHLGLMLACLLVIKYDLLFAALLCI